MVVVGARTFPIIPVKIWDTRYIRRPYVYQLKCSTVGCKSTETAQGCFIETCWQNARDKGWRIDLYNMRYIRCPDCYKKIVEYAKSIDNVIVVCGWCLLFTILPKQGYEEGILNLGWRAEGDKYQCLWCINRKYNAQKGWKRGRYAIS